MKRFADFGIQMKMGSKKSFDCPEVSIYSVLNTEIEVVDFEKVNTSFGEGRHLVLFRQNGQLQKFFTQSAPISNALDAIPEDGFPFLATVKQRVFGKSKTFYFE